MPPIAASRPACGPNEPRIARRSGHGLDGPGRPAVALIDFASLAEPVSDAAPCGPDCDLEGDLDLDELRSHGVAATRQLAKRQLTWLRSMPHRHVVACDAPHAIDAVVALARGWSGWN